MLLDSHTRARGTGLMAYKFGYIGLLLSATLSIVNTRFAEICQSETFEPQCGESSVVVITTAAYGRMRLGTCVQQDYGSIGCAADVLHILDRMCSGLHACSVTVPHANFDAMSPCPGEFKTYLEVEYKCVKVYLPPPDICLYSREVVMTSAPGIISSHVSTTHSVGTVQCPLRITLPLGQRINLTLYDFSVPTLAHRLYEVCPQYAMVTERASVQDRNTRICGGSTRITTQYISRTNSIELRIVEGLPRPGDVDGPRSNYQWLLKYEAIGCARPHRPHNGWWQYSVDNEVVFGCNSSDVTWYQHCVGTTWQGTAKNCTQQPKSGPVGMVRWGTLSMPYGVSLGIIIGLAVIVGIIILLVGLICMEWKKMRRAQAKHPSPTELLTSAKRPDDEEYNKSLCRQHSSAGGTLLPPPPPQCAPARHNDYAYHKDQWGGSVHQPSPNHYPATEHSNQLPPYGGTSNSLPVNPHPIREMSADSEEDELQYTGHVYESPTAVRRHPGLHQGQLGAHQGQQGAHPGLGANGLGPYYEYDPNSGRDKLMDTSGSVSHPGVAGDPFPTYARGGSDRGVDPSERPPCYTKEINDSVTINANAAVLVDFNRL